MRMKRWIGLCLVLAMLLSLLEGACGKGKRGSENLHQYVFV